MIRPWPARPFVGSRRGIAKFGVTILVVALVFAACGDEQTASASPSVSARATGPIGTAALVRVGSFTATNPAAVRYYQSATLLRDGRVLIVGGCCAAGTGAVPLTSAELFDPKTGKFSSTGSLTTPRMYQSATLLSDGRVLIAGGMSDTGSLATTEIYSTITGKFTAGPTMLLSRYNQTATLLKDGRVLLAGGSTGLDTAELFDPTINKFVMAGVDPTSVASPKPSAAMGHARTGHTATLLTNGLVLIVGGQFRPQSAELYDPQKDKFTATGELSYGRYNHTATLLNDGRVLILGGAISEGTAEIYDPLKGDFSPAPSAIEFRTAHTATLLSDGRVLFTGGLPPNNSGEIYNPKTGLFNPANPMVGARTSACATLLQDGRVLISGGIGSYGSTAPDEIYKI